MKLAKTAPMGGKIWTRPFVFLSLLAIQHTSTGIASTIMAIVPVLIIPFAVVLFKEKVNAKEIVGAVIAVIGTAIMFS